MGQWCSAMTDNTNVGYTVLPWRVSGPDRDHPYLAWIMGGDGLSVLAISEDSLPDAHLIVKAVNSHVELVEALRAVLPYVSVGAFGQCYCSHHGRCAVHLQQDARALLDRIDQGRTA